MRGGVRLSAALNRTGEMPGILVLSNTSEHHSPFGRRSSSFYPELVEGPPDLLASKSV